MTDPGTVQPPRPDQAAAQPTGEPRVDAALARLGELDQRPITEHGEVYEDVQARLHAALADLGED